MKLRVSTCVLLFLGLIFSGCVSATQMAQPTQVTHPSVATIFATPTFVRMAPSSIPYLPIGTLKPELSQIVISTNTPIPSNTLEPQKAHEVIAALLQEAIDCSAPCFWGIVPGQTSPVDALSKFNHLGIQAQIISLKDLITGHFKKWRSSNRVHSSSSYQGRTEKNDGQSSSVSYH